MEKHGELPDLANLEDVVPFLQVDFTFMTTVPGNANLGEADC